LYPQVEIKYKKNKSKVQYFICMFIAYPYNDLKSEVDFRRMNGE